jgi:hypothetical protein
VNLWDTLYTQRPSRDLTRNLRINEAGLPLLSVSVCVVRRVGTILVTQCSNPAQYVLWCGVSYSSCQSRSIFSHGASPLQSIVHPELREDKWTGAVIEYEAYFLQTWLPGGELGRKVGFRGFQGDVNEVRGSFVFRILCHVVFWLNASVSEKYTW